MKLLFQLYIHVSVCVRVYVHIYIRLLNKIYVTVDHSLKKNLIDMMTKKSALWFLLVIWVLPCLAFLTHST